MMKHLRSVDALGRRRLLKSLRDNIDVFIFLLSLHQLLVSAALNL